MGLPARYSSTTTSNSSPSLNSTSWLTDQVALPSGPIVSTGPGRLGVNFMSRSLSAHSSFPLPAHSLFAIGSRIAAAMTIVNKPRTPSLALLGMGRLRMRLIRPDRAPLDSTTPINRRLRTGRRKASFATSTNVCGYCSACSPIATSTVSSTACSRALRIIALASQSRGL